MFTLSCLGADDHDELSPWVAESQQRIVPSEASSGVQFGGEAALAGDTAVVADREERNEQVDDVGAVYVSRRIGNRPLKRDVDVEPSAALR